MILTFILFFLIVAFILIELAYRSKYNFVFMVFAALIFIWLGVLILASGVDLQSGITINVMNSTVSNVTTSYQNFNTSEFRFFGILFLGIGMLLIWFGWLMYQGWANEK